MCATEPTALPGPPYYEWATPPISKSNWDYITLNITNKYFLDTPNETAGQPSAVHDGTTYWANSVYVVFGTVSGWNSCGPLGKTVTSGMVTLKSSELSSLRGFYGTEPYSFNFADLIEPVPWIAWVGQSSCRVPADCETVTPGKFAPILAIPAQVKLLDPAWMLCQLPFRGIYDPPTAVYTIPDFLTDTSSASPAATPVSEVAPLTSTSQPVSAVPTQTQPESASSIQLPASTVVGPISSFGDPPATLTHTSAPLQTIGGITVSVDPSNLGAVVIGTATLKPGDVTTINGNTPVSVGTGTLVVGTSTVVLPPSTPADATTGAVLTIGSQTLTAAPTGLVVGATTLTPGGPALTTAGSTLSLNSQGLVVAGPSGTSTLSFSAISAGPADPISEAVFTLGSQTLTAIPTSLVIGATTLSPGGPALTTNGETISLGTSGVVIAGPAGTSTILFADPSAEAVFTVGSGLVTAAPTGVVIGSVTLMPGGPALTTDGETISLGPSGVVVAGPAGMSTIAFSDPGVVTEALFTLGSEILTAEPTGLVIGSSTLRVGGPAVTTDGETISLGPSGVVVVGPGGTSTVPFSTVVPSASVLQYTGGAAKAFVEGGRVVPGLGFVILGLLELV